MVEKVCFAALFRIRHDPLKLYYVRLFFTFTQEKVNFDSKEKLMCLRSFGKPVSSVRGRAVGGVTVLSDTDVSSPQGCITYRQALSGAFDQLSKSKWIGRFSCRDTV